MKEVRETPAGYAKRSFILESYHNKTFGDSQYLSG